MKRKNLLSKELVRIKFPPKKRYSFGQRVEKSLFYGGNVTLFWGGGGRGHSADDRRRAQRLFLSYILLLGKRSFTYLLLIT